MTILLSFCGMSMSGLQKLAAVWSDHLGQDITPAMAEGMLADLYGCRDHMVQPFGIRVAPARPYLGMPDATGLPLPIDLPPDDGAGVVQAWRYASCEVLGDE